MHTLSLGGVAALRLLPPEVYHVAATRGVVHTRRLVVRTADGEVQIDFMAESAHGVEVEVVAPPAEPRCAGDVDREFAAVGPVCPGCKSECYVLAGRSRCCDKPVGDFPDTAGSIADLLSHRQAVAVVRDDDADDGDELDPDATPLEEHGDPVGRGIPQLEPEGEEMLADLMDLMSAQPTLNEYWSYPAGTWADEAAYRAWKLANPGKRFDASSDTPIARRPALDHLEPRDIADRRVEHGERA
jgi:hypothetical protein